MKTVDIIIPVYNDAASIIDSVESAIAQKYVHTNVIVVNDGSNDETEAVLQKSPYWQSIKYVVKANGGAASARNAGLGLRNMSDYCCFLDSDDILAPTFALTMIEAMKSGCADMAYSDYQLVDAADPLIVLDLFRDQESKIWHFAEIIAKNRFMTPTILVKGDLCSGINFDECLRYNEDWLFWLKLLEKCERIIPCYQPLVRIRTRSNGLTARKDLHADNYLKTLEIIEDRYSSRYSSAFRTACVTYANNLAAFNKQRAAWTYMKKAFPSRAFFFSLPTYVSKIIIRKLGLEIFAKRILKRSGGRRQIVA